MSVGSARRESFFNEMISQNPNSYSYNDDFQERRTDQDSYYDRESGQFFSFRRSQDSQNDRNTQSRHQSRRNIEQSLTSQNQVWKIKANRKAIENRYGLQKNTVTAIMTVLSVGGTVVKLDLRIQIIFYLLWLITILLADPLGAIGRFLALPSRVMIAGSCCMVLLLFARPGLDTLLLTVVATCITALCIKFLNNSWLAADNWSNTQAVQKALLHDPNSNAGRNWQADGRREVRTALAEMGISTDTDCLDTLHRTAFEIGYSHGLQKTGQIRATESKLQQAREEIADYKEQCNKLQYNLDAAQTERNRADIISSQADVWRKKYAELKRENEQLMQANEELLQGYQEEEPEQEPEKVVQFHREPEIPESVEERVLYARNVLKYSYDKTAEFAGCSHGKAYAIVKAAEQQAAAL